MGGFPATPLQDTACPGVDPVAQLVQLLPVRRADLDGEGADDGADLDALLSDWAG